MMRCGVMNAGRLWTEPKAGTLIRTRLIRSRGNGGFYQDNRDRYSDYSSYDKEPVYERQSGARKGFAITSLVLGIVGLLGTCWLLYDLGACSALF